MLDSAVSYSQIFPPSRLRTQVPSSGRPTLTGQSPDIPPLGQNHKAASKCILNTELRNEGNEIRPVNHVPIRCLPTTLPVVPHRWKQLWKLHHHAGLDQTSGSHEGKVRLTRSSWVPASLCELCSHTLTSKMAKQGPG